MPGKILIRTLLQFELLKLKNMYTWMYLVIVLKQRGLLSVIHQHCKIAHWLCQIEA